MPEVDPVLVFVTRLNQLEARYMVTGSVASIAYGEPRLTHDIDIVVELDRIQAGRLALSFPAPDFYCPPIDIIRLELARECGGHFNIIHQGTGFKADIYPLGQDPWSAWGLSRSRRFLLEGIPMILAPPEYVITRKLEYFQEGGSEKHLRDIRSILRVSRALLNLEELERWIQNRHLEQGWKRVHELPLGDR
jgi:hypothetical protein